MQTRIHSNWKLIEFARLGYKVDSGKLKEQMLVSLASVEDEEEVIALDLLQR